MKAHYALGLLLALASCKGSEVAATKEPAAPSTHVTRTTPDTGTLPSPGIASYKKQVAESDQLQPVPPAPPLNPTRAEAKAYKARLSTYKDQLKAWRKVQVAQAKAYATANRGPLIQGKGAVNAPAATEVVNAYKPSAPVVKASDSATVYAASSKTGPVVAGKDNVVPITTEEALDWKAVLAKTVGVVLGVVVLGGVAYLLFFRRKDSTETTV